MTSVRTSQSDFNHDYDIVIIGSGAGGGTVAEALAPLCSKGLRIALLEYGGRLGPKDLSRHEVDMASKLYFDNGGFQTVSQDMTLAFAHGVGGSTNVYTGVTFQLPQMVFNQWGISDEDYSTFSSRMEKLSQACNVHYLPDEEINQNNRLFKAGVESLGWEAKQFPLNVKDCRGLNTCNLGCPNSAKQGTAVVQIPKAESLGVEVIPYCHVSHIENQTVHADVVPPQKGLEKSPWPVGHHNISSRKIVVCAGAVNSSAILLRSFDSKEFPTLGRYLTCHPALMLAAEHAERVDGMQGHPKSYYCDDFVDGDNFLIETCMYFPFSLAKNLVGFGSDIEEFINRYPYLQMILTLVLDPALERNRVTLDRNGNPQVHYQLSPFVMDAFVKSVRASGRIFFASGAKRAHLPGTKDFFTYAKDKRDLDSLVQTTLFKPGKVSITSAHLMGGCRMGSDPSNSVTDFRGKVHGTDNLYVADGGLFPSCSRVNPYLTIMALAERVAEGILLEMG